ncbi:MAG: RHS repeat-associated core domain-containing protein [Planctomycetota bacterium]
MLQDANMNVIAAADEAGAILERYRYDPYGTRTVLDLDFSDDADNVSDFAMRHGHQGGRYVEALDAYHFRHRFYSPQLQRWLNPDPAGYVDGPNVYGYVMADPINYRDPMGLTATEGDDELEHKNPFDLTPT